MRIERENQVVVAGASGGIGRAVAEAYGGRQAKVALLARGRAGLDAAQLWASQHHGMMAAVAGALLAGGLALRRRAR
jgi:short-subunit dehydrogenase